jgi:hypothetical protein
MLIRNCHRLLGARRAASMIIERGEDDEMSHRQSRQSITIDAHDSA